MGVSKGKGWRVRQLGFLIAALAPLACIGPAGAASKKVIIDTDPGADDALAILLALRSPALEVLAITVVAGNVEVALGAENALKLLELAGRTEIPVARGAEKPLSRTLTTAELFHGDNGLGGIELPKSKISTRSEHAVDLILSMVNARPGEITLITLGPLTNIAMALLKDPSIKGKVKGIISMGGSISGGNVTPAAEFNYFNDPEAAKTVFDSGIPITMVGLDVTNKALLRREHLEPLKAAKSPVHDFIVGLATIGIDFAALYRIPGFQMHDPLTVGVAIDPSLVTMRRMRIEIETKGELTAGQTVAYRDNLVARRVETGGRYRIAGLRPVEPNADVCLEVDVERFIKLFIETIKER